MKKPHFEKDQLVSVTGESGRIVTAMVRRVEPIGENTYEVLYEDMQTGDRFKRKYLYD